MRVESPVDAISRHDTLSRAAGATFGAARTFYEAMGPRIPRPAAGTERPSLPILELLILLALISGGLTVRVNLSRLRARAEQAATADPAGQVPTTTPAPAARPADRRHRTMS